MCRLREGKADLIVTAVKLRADDAVRPGPRTCPHASAAGGRATAAAASRVAVRETQRRRGRYVHYSVDLPALTALGADLLAAMLR